MSEKDRLKALLGDRLDAERYALEAREEARASNNPRAGTFKANFAGVAAARAGMAATECPFGDTEPMLREHWHKGFGALAGAAAASPDFVLRYPGGRTAADWSARREDWEGTP